MTNSAAASAFGQWLQSISPKYQLDLTTVSRAGADAGFRSYHRIAAADGRSFIAMNAEGETPESFASFIKVDGLLRNEAGLNAPEIFEADTDHRFMLLSDLGRETYLDVLNEDNARELMDRATTALVAWQKISRPNVLPAYSREVLQRELELFPTWYVGRHRGVEWTEEQQKWWRMATEAILDTNCREALVFVHRDFMPRNLMVSDPMPGTSTSRTRSTVRSATTSPRSCATPSSPGTRASCSTPRSAIGRRPARRASPCPPTSATSTATSSSWACSAI